MFLEEVFFKLVADKLSNGPPSRRYMVEVRGSHMIGIDCNLIERVYDHATSNELLDEIRNAWLRHAKERGIDQIEADEDFTMTLATFLAALMTDRRLMESTHNHASSHSLQEVPAQP